MPYSEYAVTDRKAMSQLKYHIRRFKRQMAECGTDPADIERIIIALDLALLEAVTSIDFNDDGSRMEVE